MKTDKQAIVNEIENVLRNRLDNLGHKPGKGKKAITEEAAFLCGASAALQAVFGNSEAEALSNYIPPRWVISIMRGETVLDPVIKGKVGEGKPA